MKQVLAVMAMATVCAFCKVSTDDLTLYVRQTCPYCKRVTRYMNEHNIKIKTVDISRNAEARSTLIEKGGKKQVPCLFIKDQPMYESKDIINYLKKEFVN